MSSEMKRPERAFIFRLKPGYHDALIESLEKNELITGWGCAGDLRTCTEWYQFREAIYQGCCPNDDNYRRAGGWASSLYNFIHSMQIGDWVVVPCPKHFYIAEVKGAANFDKSKIEVDMAYRRPVEWLNNRNPIPRDQARASLISRMKARQTCVDANDLIPDLWRILEETETGKPSTFTEDLRRKLVAEAKKEISEGKVDPNKFEKLVASVLKSLGANDPKPVPKQYDKGADILAVFNIVNNFTITVAVQVRHHKGYTDPSAIKDLIMGMNAEGTTFGLVVTSGDFNEDCVELCEKVKDDKGLEIELIDGDQLASMIVDFGLKNLIL